MRIMIDKSNPKLVNINLLDHKLEELYKERTSLNEHIEVIESVKDQINKGIFPHEHLLIL